MPVKVIDEDRGRAVLTRCGIPNPHVSETRVARSRSQYPATVSILSALRRARRRDGGCAPWHPFAMRAKSDVSKLASK